MQAAAKLGRLLCRLLWKLEIGPCQSRQSSSPESDAAAWPRLLFISPRQPPSLHIPSSLQEHCRCRRDSHNNREYLIELPYSVDRW